MNLCKTMLLLITFMVMRTFAEEPSFNLLFQEALYTEETEGDIENAIIQYKEVLALTKSDSTNSFQETISKVEYHLGVCYLKQGNQELAIEQFQKVLEQFEGHDKTHNLARNYLQELNPEFKEKQILPLFVSTPWKSGEQLDYKVYSENGGEIGRVVYNVNDTTIDNIAHYIIDRSEMITTYWYPSYSQAIVGAEKLMPRSSVTKVGTDMEWRAAYDGNTISYSTDVNGKKSENETVLEQPLFDNESVFYLLRKVPLALGYKDSAMVFSNMNGMYVKGQLEVEAIEMITTSAGTFNCFKVEVSSSFQGEQNYQETYWISSDENRVVVQTESEAYTLKLANVNYEHSPSQTVLRDDRSELIITLPDEYLTYCSRTTWSNEAVYSIYSHKNMASIRFKVSKRPKGKSSDELQKMLMKTYRNSHKKYNVRKSETVKKTVNGIEARLHIADVKEKQTPVPFTEYRTFFYTDSLVYTLEFRVQEDHFDMNRKEFESIIEAVTLK